jgi:hypothetical protein
MISAKGPSLRITRRALAWQITVADGVDAAPFR